MPEQSQKNHQIKQRTASLDVKSYYQTCECQTTRTEHNIVLVAMTNSHFYRC